MDNASKAIIIAGAILIAVLIVSLGVTMFNSASQVVETTESSIASGTVAQYNAQFEKYFGNDRSREQAKALARLVKISKANDGPNITCPEPNTFDNDRASDKYDIKGYYDTSTGYLNSITITKKP